MSGDSREGAISSRPSGSGWSRSPHHTCEPRCSGAARDHPVGRCQARRPERSPSPCRKRNCRGRPRSGNRLNVSVTTFPPRRGDFSRTVTMAPALQETVSGCQAGDSASDDDDPRRVRGVNHDVGVGE